MQRLQLVVKRDIVTFSAHIKTLFPVEKNVNTSLNFVLKESIINDLPSNDFCCR